MLRRRSHCCSARGFEERADARCDCAADLSRGQPDAETVFERGRPVEQALHITVEYARNLLGHSGLTVKADGNPVGTSRAS